MSIDMDAINRIFASILPRQPNMRYWEAKRGDPYKFCWTTQRTSDGKFWALIYRLLKDGTWVLKKKVAFGRRRIAKKRAHTWMEKRREQLNNN